MEQEDLNKLLNDLEKSSFSKIEVKFDNVYLNLEKSENKIVSSESTSIDKIEENSSEYLIKDIEENEDVKIIKSPMVGVFYRSPNPDEDAFVKEGDEITKGDTIGIIEAMKLMNEVVSDFDGEIVEVCCEDKSNVGYGQPLIKVKIK